MKICAICEGSYPFVAGGVSSWLQSLIKGLPQHTFTIWTIGAQEKQKGRYAYELPPNVDRVVDVYLDSVQGKRLRPVLRAPRMTRPQKEAVRRLLQSEDPDWPEVFGLFCKNPRRNVEFLMDHEFLRLLEEICLADHPDVSFIDYFWTVRSMFLPLLYVLGSEIPQADLYYSVSAGYAGVLGAMAALRTGKPYVLTEHGIYTREREEEILRTNWVLPQFKDLWIDMFYMFTRCAYRYASRVTALFSRASLIQQEIGCEASRCMVIPNGVDYERFSGIPPKTPDGFIDIGAVVRIVPIKDIKTMLYAFKLVCLERQDVRLHIMGPTEEDEEYFAECRRLQEDLELKNVVFTGRVDVRGYLERIDFTLLTSISEGQPLAVLEALAAGRPAVTTDVGSCRELLMGPADDFGPAGLCVPVMHQSALARAMLTLCADEKVRARMGEAGRRRVYAHYRQATMLERYEEVFQRVLYEGMGRNAWRASVLS